MMIADSRNKSWMGKRRYECPSVVKRRGFDRNIKRRVLDYLSFRGIERLEHVTVNVSNRNVTLSGVISSFPAKRRLYECCRSVAGVLNVNDWLIVMPGCSRSAG